MESCVLLHRPFARVHDLVREVPVVVATSLSQHPDTDFDEGPARLGVFPAEHGLELVHRALKGAARPGDNVRSLENPIDHLGIDPVEPRSIEVVALVLQTVNSSRPIETGRAIVAILCVRQIDLRGNLPVRDLSLGKLRRVGWRQTDAEAQQQGERRAHLRRHTIDDAAGAGTP